MEQKLQEFIDFQLANEKTTRKISALEHDGTLFQLPRNL